MTNPLGAGYQGGFAFVVLLAASLGLGVLGRSGRLSATVEIQAHRGGPNIDGKADASPRTPCPHSSTRSSRATRSSSTSRALPTTLPWSCTTRSSTGPRPAPDSSTDKTLAQLASCRLDVLGSEDSRRDRLPAEADRSRSRRSTEVICAAREDRRGRRTSKSRTWPATFPEFPPDTYRQLEASGIPSSRITVQNFKPDSLDRGPRRSTRVSRPRTSRSSS